MLATDTSLCLTPDGYMAGDKGTYLYTKCRPLLAQFVNRSTIAGSYADERNRKYVFVENGVTTWNIVKYSYEVNLDYTLGGDDIFAIKSADNMKLLSTYGFVTEGNRLLIYKVDRSESCEGLTRVGKPLMVLRKLR